MFLSSVAMTSSFALTLGKLYLFYFEILYMFIIIMGYSSTISNANHNIQVTGFPCVCLSVPKDSSIK